MNEQWDIREDKLHEWTWKTWFFLSFTITFGLILAAAAWLT